jgi:hypothetical protein
MKTASLAPLAALALVTACQVTVKDTQTPEPEGEETAPPAQTAAPAPAPTSEPDPSVAEKLEKLKGQKMCTTMGCIDGLTVDVDKQVWPKGKYKFVINADDKSTTCEGALPLPACDKGKALTCKGDVDVMIAESGCALPPEQHGFGTLTFKGMPKKVRVVVTRDGKEFAKGDFTPSYKKVQPNGPDCEPTCNHASEKMTVR